MTTTAFTLPPPRRKARVKQVPGAPLPLPSALPHAPCTHYEATYCQGSITIRDPSQAEALWQNGCFGHGAVMGGRGGPKGQKKWRLVEAEGLKSPKWFKETRTEQRGVEGGVEREVEENEMEVDLSEEKEKEVEEEEEEDMKEEKRKGLEIMEVKENVDKEEKNEETEEVKVKEDKEEDEEEEEKKEEENEMEEEEKGEENEMEEETQDMETKASVDTEKDDRLTPNKEEEEKEKDDETEKTHKDKTKTPNTGEHERLPTDQEKKKEDKENTPEPKEELGESEEEETNSDPELTEPWKTILVLSPDQKGYRGKHNRDTCLSLLPEEALFLSYALGCLVLTHEEVDESCKGRKRALDEPTSHEMTIDEMWRVFSQQDASFPVKYAVYHHYRTLGWVVKAGLKYGVDYVLYPVGPAFYHSQYAVRVYSVWADTLTLDTTVPGHTSSWTTTATTERLANHVNKTPIICFVVRPRALTQSRLGLIDCLKELKVQEMMLTRWSPANGIV
ncbi:tRNA-splicing endonuclease subunit Sen2-like [Scylla paramamosain]|uniref:tRNA-splicing endonuclease subunit Sen2-like n=1 Tax=Scylla paramamosain TaxID=85552 RepID=UPI003083AA64